MTDKRPIPKAELKRILVAERQIFGWLAVALLLGAAAMKAVA